MKKLITCLCMALAATLGSATLKAQYGPLPGGGYGNSSINWKYETATRTLTLTGYGRIPDYSNLQPAPWAKHRAQIKSIVIGSGITSIGEYAFAGSSALTSVQIPAGVTQIEDYAFANCSALPAITLPIGVTEIEKGVFLNCSSLRSVTLPQGMQKVGDGAFANCTSLPSITLPLGLREIEKGAFSGCTSLASVSFPAAGLTDIDEGAFYGCTALKAATLPLGLREIDKNAFWGCTSLTNVSIPASVTEIKSGAFGGCTGLRSVTVGWTVPPMPRYPIFPSVPVANVQLNVPRGTESTYRSMPVWNEFLKIGTVANAEVDGRRIYATDGVLYLTLPQPELVRIFDVSGRLLQTFSAPAGSSTLRLKAGYHIVQVGGTAEKVYAN